MAARSSALSTPFCRLSTSAPASRCGAHAPPRRCRATSRRRARDRHRARRRSRVSRAAGGPLPALLPSRKPSRRDRLDMRARPISTTWLAGTRQHAPNQLPTALAPTTAMPLKGVGSFMARRVCRRATAVARLRFAAIPTSTNHERRHHNARPQSPGSKQPPVLFRQDAVIGKSWLSSSAPDRELLEQPARFRCATPTCWRCTTCWALASAKHDTIHLFIKS